MFEAHWDHSTHKIYALSLKREFIKKSCFYFSFLFRTFGVCVSSAQFTSTSMILRVIESQNCSVAQPFDRACVCSFGCFPLIGFTKLLCCIQKTVEGSNGSSARNLSSDLKSHRIQFALMQVWILPEQRIYSFWFVEIIMKQSAFFRYIFPIIYKSVCPL